MQARNTARKVQTSLRVPKPIYEQVKVCLKKGMTSAETINDFIVAAIQFYTKVLERKSIDAAFAHMAEDANYQKAAQLIAEEFTQSDWDALEEARRP